MRRLLYRVFRSFSALQHRVRRRLTPAGQLVAAGLLAAIIVGPNTRLTVAYQAATFLAALLVVAALGVLARPPRLQLQRRLPRFATVGEPLTYPVLVRNPGPRAAPDWLCSRTTPTPDRRFEEFRDTPDPGEARRNRFDRVVGYPRWAWLVSQNLQARGRRARAAGGAGRRSGGSAPDADAAPPGAARADRQLAGPPRAARAHARAAHRAVARHAADPAAPLRAASAGAAAADVASSAAASRWRRPSETRRSSPPCATTGRAIRSSAFTGGAGRAPGGRWCASTRTSSSCATPSCSTRSCPRRPRRSRRPCRWRRRSRARSAPRSRCWTCSSSAPKRTASPRGAVSVTWIDCSRSWPRCGRAATGPSPRCRDSCWSTSVRSRAPCWCCVAWDEARRELVDRLRAVGVPPRRVVLVTDGSVVRHAARRAPRHGRSRGRRPPAALMRSPLLGIALRVLGLADGPAPGRPRDGGGARGAHAHAVALGSEPPRLQPRVRPERDPARGDGDLRGGRQRDGAGRDRHHPVAADGHVPGHRLPGLQCRRPRGDGGVLLVHAPASGGAGRRST